MNRRPRSSAVLTAVTVAALATGCSSAASSTDAAQTSGVSSTATPSSTVSPTGLEAGSIPVIAEQRDLPVGTDGQDTVTVGIKSLSTSADGKTMVLWLVFTPQFGSLEADDTVSLFNLNDPMYMLPVLLDRQNLKRYTVVSQDSTWYTSASDTAATNGRSFEAWFLFSAPQDDVSTLELKVTDQWPSFLDVPVSSS